jgi:hypothetical protein
VQYGRFDDANREYVIDRPDTPRSWSNYLGNTRYGAIVTNNAGGYSFFHSAVQGRFTRLWFNNVPLDQPGRYFYLRDRDSGDFWSGSCSPSASRSSGSRPVAATGPATPILTARYDGIVTESTYFVPLESGFRGLAARGHLTRADRPRRALHGVPLSSSTRANGGRTTTSSTCSTTQYIVRCELVDGMSRAGASATPSPRIRRTSRTENQYPPHLLRRRRR